MNSKYRRDSILVFLVFPVFHADLDKKNRKNKYASIRFVSDDLASLTGVS